MEGDDSLCRLGIILTSEYFQGRYPNTYSQASMYMDEVRSMYRQELLTVHAYHIHCLNLRPLIGPDGGR